MSSVHRGRSAVSLRIGPKDPCPRSAPHAKCSGYLRDDSEDLSPGSVLYGKSSVDLPANRGILACVGYG